jgi:hypothetical protein
VSKNNYILIPGNSLILKKPKKIKRYSMSNETPYFDPKGTNAKGCIVGQ